MKHLKQSEVEAELVKIIDEVNKNISTVETDVDADCIPGHIGISSQILITIMGRVSNALEVVIPDDCYIFYDKKTNRQLTIREAAKKLIEKSTDGTQ